MCQSVSTVRVLSFKSLTLFIPQNAASQLSSWPGQPGQSTGTVTGLSAGRSRVRMPVDARDISLLQRSRQALEPTQLPIPKEPELFPVVRRSEREVNHYPPSSAEVKKEWSCTSTTLMRLRGVDRKNLTVSSWPANCFSLRRIQ